jgi:hypothetical protein
MEMAKAEESLNAAELCYAIAERCVDILVEAGVFLCTAVYEPDK